MGQYIIEVISFQALFLVAYLLFFRRETFFQLNRVYLLLTSAIALVLPFMHISFFENMIPVQRFVSVLPEVVIGTTVETQSAPSSIPSTFQFNWFWVYGVGAGISIFFLAFKLSKLSNLFRHKQKNNPIIDVPASSEAFSFLNYIFIGTEIDTLSRKRILAHEYIHLKQRHTWDLLYFEFLRIIFWFNPLVYLYQKETTIVHEYLADAEVVRHTPKEAYYTALLNTTFGTQKLSFINSFFNHSFIKNRIIMLQKSNSKKTALIKYTLIIPIILGMLFYVSCSEDYTPQDNNSSLKEQIADLRVEFETKEEISEEEYEEFIKMVQATLNSDESKNRVLEAINVSKLRSPDNQIMQVVEVQEVDPNTDVPFAVIENVPVFPGCEGSSTNEERKQCMSQKITTIVNRNFNTELGRDNGLSGINRVFVQFKIDTQGNVTEIKSRGNHKSLEDEAERVIKLLPEMKPGIHKGKPVNVLYALPITFKIAD